MELRGVIRARAKIILITFLLLLLIPSPSFAAPRPVRIPRVRRAAKACSKTIDSEKHLYFPLLLNGSDYISYIGLVNMDSHSVNYTIHIMASDGDEVITPISGTLEQLGRIYTPVSTEELDGPLWGEVISDGNLTGYLNLLGRDKTRSMFVRASTSLEKQLYLPHIAPEVDYWNTYTAIINGNRTDSESSNIFLNYISGSQPLSGPIKPLTQYWFEWAEDVFSDGFPDGMPFWGKIWNNVSAVKTDNVIAGMELFVRKGDGIHQECGLDLSSGTASTLYFPHIDVNGNYWWTGIAIENVSTGPATVVFQPYDSAGSALTPVSYDMDASRKLVKVVQSFWTDQDIDFPTATAWIKVSTEKGRLIGYELFGTLDAAGYRLLAGINAPCAGAGMLLYPHVDSSDDYWTGIALVNLGSASATVTATAYDDTGKSLKTITLSSSLSPNQKIVDTVKNFFTDDENSGPPDGTSQILVESTEPIVGFELWGNLTPEQDYISGMLATPFPPVVFSESFEHDNFSTENSPWSVWPLSDNQEPGLGWDLSSLINYGTGDTFRSKYPQSIPDGFDYIVGFYGEQNSRNHQILVSPLIQLSDSVTEASFYSQFGWSSYASDSDAFYITEDTNIGEGWSLDNATALKTFTPQYIKGLPLSNEPNVSTGDLSFTRWKRESFDISAYAGKTIRFIFEINSRYGESWHVDQFQIR